MIFFEIFSKIKRRKRKMEIKVMVVPGKIAKVQVSEGSTVLAACEAAAKQIPGVDWVNLAKDREVRVQNRKFSNCAEAKDGTFGSITNTPLNNGDVILVLTKIKGNTEPGYGALTCTINGEGYALETPEQIGKVLKDVVGINMDKIQSIMINGIEADSTQLIGSDDDIQVMMIPETQTPITIITHAIQSSDIFEQLRNDFAAKNARITELEKENSDLLSTVGQLNQELENIGYADENKTFMRIIFGGLDERLQTMEIQNGVTLQDILDDQEELEQKKVLLNGSVFTDDPEEHELKDGDSVIIVPTTKNGLRVKMTL
jgi:molybdopterin converting factor small subunit